MGDSPTREPERQASPESDASKAQAPMTGRPTLARPLTDREMEVLQCLPTRLTTSEIGMTLNISMYTVRTHLRSIYSKLNVRSRNEAILQGARHRLIASNAEWLVKH